MQQYVCDSGMILRSEPYSEYDKRVVILTKDHGKITAFAKGARRQGNRLTAATDLFCFAEYKLYAGKESYTLVDATVKTYFDELRGDMEAALYGMYFLEVMEYQTRENNDEEQLLILLYMACKALTNAQIDRKLVKSVFEIKTVVLQGEFRQKYEGNYCESTQYTMEFIVNTSAKKLFTFMLKEEPLREIIEIANNIRHNTWKHEFKSEAMLQIMSS